MPCKPEELHHVRLFELHPVESVPLHAGSRRMSLLLDMLVDVEEIVPKTARPAGASETQTIAAQS
jgi:hypothetical protein